MNKLKFCLIIPSIIGDSQKSRKKFVGQQKNPFGSRNFLVYSHSSHQLEKLLIEKLTEEIKPLFLKKNEFENLVMPKLILSFANFQISGLPWMQANQCNFAARFSTCQKLLIKTLIEEISQKLQIKIILIIKISEH